MGTLIALLVFSFLIFFHELGHFLAARFFGVHVEVFSIGFGKRLLTKKFGATEWSLSLIPLGGYVRMKGQNDSNPLLKLYDEDSYNAKTPFQRIIISLAGPFANFLLAFLLYLTITSIGIPKILTTLSDVNVTHPAYKAGIRTGDTITSINGTPTAYWEDISQNILQESKLLNVTILRENKYIDVKIMPITYKTENRFGEIKTRYIIGVSANQNITETIHYTFWNGLDYAYNKTIDSSKYIFKSLEKLIMGEIPLENLGGAVGIVSVTSQVAQMGMVFLLAFAALISVNLGVINLLPIPALDGGHIMFHTYELITKKPANEDIMLKLTLLGWGILLSLMLLGLYNDINRLLG